ncbi:MAG: cytochrome c biogenesis protein CcsA [Fluviicola sp.]
MDKFLSKLFSIRLMAVALFIFLAAIGIATFIESKEHVQASKLWVYNATWFEILLAYLSISLIANIFRYQMWKREKIAILVFHIAFIVIIIGAWFTRNISFEGSMPIREGAASNVIFTADPYIMVKANDGKLQYSADKKAYLAESYWNNDADFDFEFPNHKNRISIEYVDFKYHYKDSIEISSKHKTSALEIVTDGKKSNFVLEDDFKNFQSFDLTFSKNEVQGVSVYRKNGKLFFKSTLPIRYLPMTKMREARQSGMEVPDSAYVSILPGEESEFFPVTLYLINGQQFVFKQELKNVGKKLYPTGSKKEGLDYLTVRLTDGTQSKEITLEGGMGVNGTPQFFQFAGLNYQLQYGSKMIQTPFYVKCEDFKIVRYPGSMTPSSYSSDLQMLDTARNYFGKKNIIMNHVWDYEGYRFFQSSYDPDEKGTVLSVNHDFWGTNITYLGYLMLFIGMVMSIFMPYGRFRDLLTKLNKSNALTVLFFVFMTSFSFAQEVNVETHAHEKEHDHIHETEVTADTNQPQENSSQTKVAMPNKTEVHYISEEHSEELATLLVQDNEGRIVPMHTVALNIWKKLNRSNKYEDKNAVQMVFSIMYYSDYWKDQKIIQVPTACREQLKLGTYASFNELTANNNFKWVDQYNATFRKREANQSEFEKKLIKLAEKWNVFLSTYMFAYVKILPLANNPDNKWVLPLPTEEITVNDTSNLKVCGSYLSNLFMDAKSGDFTNSSADLIRLKAMQRKAAPSSILPSESKVKMEVSYNKMQIFKNTQNMYLLLSLMLMILYFIRVLTNPTVKTEKRFSLLRKILVFCVIVIFVYHGTGLGMRWQISGHVPWSNGYEAIVFIAWVTVLSGLLFSRKNSGVLPGAVLIGGLMVWVSEMNLLDPEITPLQPVLKSPWLMVHVAIITASYAFLALSFIVGIFNLILYVGRNQNNGNRVTRNINELTYINEMTMIIGLFMLTIGTFLGGIWANESWGRYWGWDPKETWALVSVLVYAIVMHFRYIPGMKSKLVFNIAAVWGYSAILFTFFGVNFILVGLHSYAQGDGAIAIPMFIWIIAFGFFLLTVYAAIKNKSYIKQQKENYESF